MLKEPVTINFAIEIVSMLRDRQDPTPAAEIVEKLGGSHSYIAKVLSKMASRGILVSNNEGYSLGKPATNITISEILAMCKDQDCGEGAKAVINKLFDLAQSVHVSDII